MTDHILGSYQHYKSENFEEFLAATNVPLVVRKVLSSTNPRVDISKDGETWTVTMKIMIKKQTNTFVIGKEFTETNPLTNVTSKVKGSSKSVNIKLKFWHNSKHNPVKVP